MDCGGVFVKYVLFIFNILFVVCGVLLIVFGSIMVSHMGEYGSAAQTFEANSVPIIILVLGCVIFMISFLGCCGAIRENSCCTLSYSVLMLLLFLCQVAMIIYVWTQNAEIMNAMSSIVDTIWAQRKTDQGVMNAMQLSFNCCGKTSFTDYILAGDDIPVSCCGAKATTCSATTAMTKPGCQQAFVSFWETNINIIRYAGLGVAGVEMVAFIFACCLGNQVRNNRRRANY